MAQNGGGDAPPLGVDAEPADANTDSDAYVTVKGNGAGVVFCTHIERVRSKEDDHTPHHRWARDADLSSVSACCGGGGRGVLTSTDELSHGQ